MAEISYIYDTYIIYIYIFRIFFCFVPTVGHGIVHRVAPSFAIKISVSGGVYY